MLVTTRVAQNPFWSHGRRYPVTENPSTIPNSTSPVHQLISRGRAYARNTNAWNMWRMTRMTIALDP